MTTSNSPRTHDDSIHNITFDPDLTSNQSENPLDFLSFMLDQPTPSPNPTQMFEQPQPEAGPSNHSASGESGSGSYSLLGTPDDLGMIRKGRDNGRGKKRSGMDMDVDVQGNVNGIGSGSGAGELGLGMGVGMGEVGMDGMFGGVNSGVDAAYNISQASLLQQQVRYDIQATRVIGRYTDVALA
jgi:hypothetical protein